MGDYNDPSLTTSNDISTEFTNDYSTKGNKSLKATPQGTGGYTGYVANTTDYSGKTIKLTVDTKTDNTNWKLQILYYYSSWSSSNSVDISTGETSPSIQMQIPAEATRVWFRMQHNGSSGDIIFTDNWCLEEV